MCPMEYENDELIFLSEENTADNTEFSGSWNVLVVDDDEEIHSVTRLALSDLVLNNRNLTFYHAYSKAQALDIIKTLGSDLAISYLMLSWKLTMRDCRWRVLCVTKWD